MLCKVPPCHMELSNRMRQGVTLKYRDIASDSFPTLHHKACDRGRGVECHYCMTGQVEGRHIEDLKHYFCHLLSSLSWVQGGLSHEYSSVMRLLMAFYSQFPHKDVFPVFLYVIPSCYQSMLNGVVNIARAHTCIGHFPPQRTSERVLLKAC